MSIAGCWCLLAAGEFATMLRAGWSTFWGDRQETHRDHSPDWLKHRFKPGRISAQDTIEVRANMFWFSGRSLFRLRKWST